MRVGQRDVNSSKEEGAPRTGLHSGLVPLLAAGERRLSANWGGSEKVLPFPPPVTQTLLCLVSNIPIVRNSGLCDLAFC